MNTIEPTYNVLKNKGIITIMESLKESELITLYLSYVNDFISVEKFAEYYNYPIESANFIIDTGRELRAIKFPSKEKRKFV